MSAINDRIPGTFSLELDLVAHSLVRTQKECVPGTATLEWAKAGLVLPSTMHLGCTSAGTFAAQ